MLEVSPIILHSVCFKISDRELNLYTHNLGIIENYINHYQHLPNIKIHTRFGVVSCSELAVLESTEDHYVNTDFDAIISSTTVIDKEGPYIESENEVRFKKEAFQVLKGIRILLLILMAYNQPACMVKYKYTEVKDFDYIVIPSEKLFFKYRKQLQALPFKSIIKYYNYEVLSNSLKPHSVE